MLVEISVDFLFQSHLEMTIPGSVQIETLSSSGDSIPHLCNARGGDASLPESYKEHEVMMILSLRISRTCI